jgi:tetratricopeptide (TPR) repeat protein
MAMKTIDFSYFIERYNTGEMDSMEKKWFQKELEGNTLLQEEVRLRKRVDDSLVKHDLIDLRQKLISLEKTRKEKVAATEGKKAAAIRFAASMAALVLIGTIYYMTSGPANHDKLFEKNFSPYNYSVASRAGDIKTDMTFKTAAELYTSGSYADAATALNEYLSHNPGKFEAVFMLGNSEMKNNNFENAISHFRSICENGDNLFIDNSQWYLALCYVKTGRDEKAIEQLEAIVNSGNVNKSKARKILRKLR